jgi:Arrestin (or S-antigen), N-terminal domain
VNTTPPSFIRVVAHFRSGACRPPPPLSSDSSLLLSPCKPSSSTYQGRSINYSCRGERERLGPFSRQRFLPLHDSVNAPATTTPTRVISETHSLYGSLVKVMSVEPLSGSSTVPSSPRNRWVNKLASRFHNRNKNISEFYVKPDDPWRAYFPGDAIKGTVILTVIKPVRVTHLVICLHGYVKVFKVTVAPGEINPEIGFLGPGRGRRAGEYMGNGLATLFEDEVVLCGDGRLKEGVYKFKFDLKLPPYSLPSSLNVGHILLVFVIRRGSWLNCLCTVRTRNHLVYNYGDFDSPYNN